MSAGGQKHPFTRLLRNKKACFETRSFELSAHPCACWFNECADDTKRRARRASVCRIMQQGTRAPSSRIYDKQSCFLCVLAPCAWSGETQTHKDGVVVRKKCTCFARLIAAKTRRMRFCHTVVGSHFSRKKSSSSRNSGPVTASKAMTLPGTSAIGNKARSGGNQDLSTD